MKKILAFALAAVLLLSLAACGNTGENETVDPAKVVIGKWELKMKTPDGVTSVQHLEFNEDGTGSYLLLEVGSDGVETQENAYDFTQVYEEGEFVCTSKKYTEYYFFTAETNTLTDKHSQGRVFKPAN